MCEAAPVSDGTSTVNAEYVAPSIKEVLQPGLKIDDFFRLNLDRPYVVQRLTPRAYFFAGGFYTTTFYVGDEGVLVLDPPERQGDGLLAAIAEVTDLPVTAIAYSHYHADHMIGAVELVAAADGELRIIASTRTVEKMKLFGSKLPAPNDTVSWPRGEFAFEGLTVRLDGFERAAHTDDASIYLLVEEQVAHVPDLVNGDQPPFRNFAVSDNHAYFRSNVNQLGALDWVHLVGGHGNVGSKDDIRFYNGYLDDLESAVGDAMVRAKFVEGADLAGIDNHAALMASWMSDLTSIATETMRPRYGRFYGFDVSTPTLAEMVVHSLISYR